MKTVQPEKDLKELAEELKKNGKKLVGIFLILMAIIGAYTSYFQVGPDEEAVIIRLGQYQGTYPPGPHFKIPFGVDKYVLVKTKRVLQEEFGFRTSNVRGRRTQYSQNNYESESLMLTGDLNVAVVEWVVHFQISDPFKYLFQIRDPGRTLRDVSESIMRRVVGDRLVTEVLTTGRVEIGDQAKILMQDVLNKYDVGIKINTVKLQDVNPPDSVKPSFNEVNAAKQEQEKMINQAEEAYNKVIPEAKGKAQKTVSEAEGFAERAVNRALGDSEKFLSVLKEYKRAPKITEKRIYLETLEGIFNKYKNIIIVDPKVKGLLPIFNNGQKGANL